MRKEVFNIFDTQQLKTSVTYYGTGSQTNFDFPFDYLRKSFIHVTINDVEVSDYSIDSRTVIFDTAPSEGAIINIYRSTDTTRLVAWADASVLKASDMTISQVQQLHILEEGQDWSKLNSLYLDENDSKWQGNNHPMKNISDPVDAKDVVTKGYMETVQGGFVMTNTALKDEATKQAGIATTKASEAAASASAAKTSETNAASSANTAKRWAEASDSPDNTTSKSAKTWASEAIGSASAAKASETNAKSSETKAANSATTATEKADVATNKASEASASASAAKTSETNAQNAASAAKTSETNAKNYSENVNVFLPSVSDSGVLSWTNKAGLPNPASVNIKGAKGDKGDTGNAATIEVGTVTTGAAGSSASVVNRGDANNAILDFILPKGADGKGSVITVNGKEPDAGGNVNVEKYTHPNSGVTAGTYRSVTVNAQGHVTAGSNTTLAIANGGTGATTPEQARENLGLGNMALEDNAIVNASISGKTITLTFADGTTKTLTMQDTAPARYITSKSGDANSWLVECNDGWLEQGGRLNANYNATVTYRKAFAVMPTLLVSTKGTSKEIVVQNRYCVQSESNTGFTVGDYHETYSVTKSWYACGYGA